MADEPRADEVFVIGKGNTSPDAAWGCSRQYSYAVNINAICDACNGAIRYHRVPYNLGQLMKLMDSEHMQGLMCAATQAELRGMKELAKEIRALKEPAK